MSRPVRCTVSYKSGLCVDEAPLELRIAVVPLRLLMLHKLFLQKLIVCVESVALNANEAKKWTNCQFLLHLGHLNRPKKFSWRISVTDVVSLCWQPSWVIPASLSLSVCDWHISFRHLALSPALLSLFLHLRESLSPTCLPARFLPWTVPELVFFFSSTVLLVPWRFPKWFLAFVPFAYRSVRPLNSSARTVR